MDHDSDCVIISHQLNTVESRQKWTTLDVIVAEKEEWDWRYKKEIKKNPQLDKLWDVPYWI